MVGFPKFGPKVGAALLALLLTGCGIGIRVPFVGVGVRVMKHDASASRSERIVTTYTRNGKTDRLEVYQGRVNLNAVDHGPVLEGDQVVLTDEGLLVNGELREPVTKPVTPPSDK